MYTKDTPGLETPGATSDESLLTTCDHCGATGLSERIAAHDCSATRLAGDEGEILDEPATDETDGRPADCGCGDWNADGDLACWSCYREGFDTPATATAGDGDA